MGRIAEEVLAVPLDCILGGKGTSTLLSGCSDSVGSRLFWDMFRATLLNRALAFLQLKAYSPSPEGHLRPASNENTSPSQP